MGVAYYGIINILFLYLLLGWISRDITRLDKKKKIAISVLFLLDALIGIGITIFMSGMTCPLSLYQTQTFNSLILFFVTGAGYTLPYYFTAILVSSMAFIISKKNVAGSRLALLAIAILLPGCGCAAYPIALALKEKHPMDAYVFFILSSLLTPFGIVMGLGMLGKEYIIWRFILAISFAYLGAWIMVLRHSGNKHMVSTTSEQSASKVSHFKSALVLDNISIMFIETFMPVLMAIFISAFLQFFLSYEAISKAILFPSTRIFAISLAWLARFCGSQDIIILSGLRDFPISETARQGFSLAANAFCLSLTPIYVQLWGKRKTALYAALTLSISLVLGAIQP